MTRDELKDLLRERKYMELLDPCLRSDETPYVFTPKVEAWPAFREEIATGLGVGREDIRVVGSARFGFSMRPSRNLADFRDTSDIDVVVVNAQAFDELWKALLRAAYPRSPMTEKLGGWLRDRRNEVYTGWLTPLAIHLDIRIFGERARPVLDVRTRWFDTLRKASRYPGRRHEDVNGRLYRTWEHAELYHLDSLAALGRTLT